MDGVQVTCWPLTRVCETRRASEHDSLVLRLQYGRHRCYWKATPKLLATHDGGARQASAGDALKVGHHGSPTSTTELFFADLPKDAVISVGRENTFGASRQEVIDGSQRRKTRLYRTDEFGLTGFCWGGMGDREVVGAAD